MANRGNLNIIKNNGEKAVKPYENDRAFPYPNMDVPASVKETASYALAEAQAIYSEYIRNQFDFPFTFTNNSSLDEGGQYDFPTLRAYSDGNQPVSKYKTMLGWNKNPNEAQQTRKGKQQLSWAIQSPARRYIDGIKGALSGIKHSAVVRAIDKYSVEELSNRKFRNIAIKKNEAYHKNNAALGGKPVYPEVVFEDEEELDMIMKTNMKFAQFHVIALKEVLQFSIDTLSNFQELEADLLEDLLVCGFCAAKDEVDIRTNKTFSKYIDIESALVPMSRFRNYRDIDRAGHIELMNFVDVLRESRPESEGGPSYTQLQAAAVMYSGGKISMNDSIWSNLDGKTLGRQYAGTILDRIKIPVMCFDYKSWNKERRTTRKREGNADYSRLVPNEYKPNGKNEVLIDTDHEAWYYGKWIIGTDTMMDWGRVSYTEATNSGKTTCRYKFYKCSKKSIMSQMIPTLDAKQILWLKFQDAWIKARPPGLDINITSLHGITDELGKTIHPAQIIRNKIQTGIGMYAQSLNRNDPKFNQGKPFEYDDGGVGKILDDYERSDQLLTISLTALTGISENMLGSEAKPNQLVQVTEMLIAGTHNRLQPIYQGVYQTKKSLIQSMACHIQDMAMFLPEGAVFYPEISQLKIAALRIGKDAKKYRYGVDIKLVATDQMNSIAFQNIQQSVAKGILSNSDALRAYGMIENGYYEECIEYLAYKERKAAENAANTQKEMIEANAQVNQQASQMSAQATAQKTQMEIEGKAMLEKMSKQLEILLDNNKAKNQMMIDDNKAKNDLFLQEQEA